VSLLRDALAKARAERDGARPAPAPAAPIATVPIPAAPPEPALARPAAPRAPAARAALRRALDARIVAVEAPGTAAAQQYANLRTHLLLALARVAGRVTVMTSAVAGEGKSLTAGNLAAALATEGDGRVVLVDADFRTPTIHTLLGVPRRPGLAEYVEGQADLAAILHRSPVERLVVVPAGGPASPQATSRRFAELIGALREQFDDVVVDAPPVLPVADARALATLAHGVLVVVRAGQTRRDLVLEALGRLHGARVLGIVLNRVERSQTAAYYGVGDGRR
jgi:capsular exopolysaccharide synthesis family protein